MSRGELTDPDPLTRFPRVSGDEPSTARAFVTVVTFSPRERG